MVGVAALPAFPVSLAFCETCLRMGAFPLFCIETLVCDEDLDIEQTFRKHKVYIEEHGGIEGGVAGWFLDQYLCLPPWEGGIGPVGYVTHRAYLKRIWDDIS